MYLRIEARQKIQRNPYFPHKKSYTVPTRHHALAMPMLTFLSLLYESLALAGLLLAGVTLFRRAFPRSPLPPALQWLLCFGACATLLSWLGMTGFFRSGVMAPALGMGFSGYALWHRRRSYAFLRKAYAAWPYIVCFILAVAVLAAIPKWCYLSGGINNTDDIRSITLTSAFAANYLKPAFVYNFSIPISYSYNLYEISAFLYAIVSGSGWPSVTLVVTSTAAIVLFYLVYALFLQTAFPQRSPLAVLVGLASITFYGSDIFIYKAAISHQHSEGWNPYQISQMATYQQWVYQYLISMGFALGALCALAEYNRQPHRHWLYAAAACTGFALTFGAITGVWLVAACGVLALFTLALNRRAIVPALPCLPIILAIAAFILYPQFYTFVGRDTIVSLQEPSLWYRRIPLEHASLRDWVNEFNILRNELGFMLIVGFMAIPLMGWDALRRREWGLLAAFAMCIAAMLGLSLTSAPASAPDWFWRGGNLLLTVGASVASVWLYEKLRVRMSVRWLHVGATLLLAPGMLNYMAENKLRYETCTPAAHAAYKINRAVALNDVIVSKGAYYKFDILLGGRSFYSNHEKDYSTTYRNYDAFLTRTLGYRPDSPPCRVTRFGMALPSRAAAMATAQGPFLRSSCDRGISFPGEAPSAPPPPAAASPRASSGKDAPRHSKGQPPAGNLHR